MQPIPVTPLQQNCRVFWNEQKLAVIVDPGGDADKITEMVKKNGLTPKEIWLTHSHFDHCGGVAGLLRLFPGVVLKAHPGEEEYRKRVEAVVEMYGIPPGMMENCPEPNEALVGGETLSFAGESFEVLFTPGHAPGHLAFYHQASKQLFAGDTLFLDSIGRTDLPGGDYSTLIRSIREKILSLPDDVKVLPGHGPDTTVGRERKENPFLR